MKPDPREVVERAQQVLADALAGGAVSADEPTERLAQLEGWLALQARLEAVIAAGVRAVDEAGDTMLAHGVSTRTWLAQTGRMTAGQAAGLIKDAHRLGRFAGVAEALAEARVGPAQAGAITDTLDRLPAGLSPAELAAGEATMIDHAATQRFDPAMLCRLGNHLVEIIAPDVADAHDSAALERAERRAQQARSLTFADDGHGSIRFRGRLPQLDGEALVAVVDAYATRDASVAARDPLAAELSSPEQRRADGLAAMVQHIQGCAAAPGAGGDRPRLVVTIAHDELLAQVRHEVDAHGVDAHGVDAHGVDDHRIGGTRAESLRTGARISAAALRRLACDCDLLPVVLGGAGQPLDVGREHRLVTGPVRAALTVRDRGCVMPGCDRPPERCEAHHIVPWQAGGPTSLANLVLLCRHHHGLIEPRPQAPPGEQWVVRIGTDGLPELLPPTRVDAARRPLRHPRFRPRALGRRRASESDDP
ncbi:DUF222 domain-containing protein [Naumannella huperziae]